MIAQLMVLSIALGSIYAQQAKPFQGINVPLNICYDECEGKDANNYTLWGESNVIIPYDTTKSAVPDYQLIQQLPNHQRAVNSLKILARSVLPDGANTQAETLWVATGGPLEGKYLYQKLVNLSISYLKPFSSVLGYSYVSVKSATLLISDSLDLSVLISPTGAFEIFRKGCTTQCNGRGYFVAP